MLTAAFFLFALNVIIGRAVHEDVPPVALSFWRWVLASVIFLPFSWRRVREQWPIILANWKLLAIMATLLIGCGNTLVYVGLQSTTALNGGVIPVARPVIIIILAWLLFRSTVRPNQWAGIAIAMVGVVLVITRGDAAVLAGFEFNRGDLWLVVSSVGIAGYMVLVPRAHGLVHPMVLVQTTMVLGSLLLLPVYLWETGLWTEAGRPMVLDWTSAGAILYVAIFPSILAMYMANLGIEALGPARAGIYNYFQPLFVAMMAMPILGEELRWFHPVALGLVIAGIVTANRGR